MVLKSCDHKTGGTTIGSSIAFLHYHPSCGLFVNVKSDGWHWHPHATTGGDKLHNHKSFRLPSNG